MLFGLKSHFCQNVTVFRPWTVGSISVGMLYGLRSNLHETHYYGFFARDVSDMGYQPGGEIMASLLPVVAHMQKLAY